MDLYAFTQIEDLDGLAKKNGIMIPRLRGYRLMGCEKPVTEEEIQKMICKQAVQEAEWLCRSDWLNIHCHEYSRRTDRIIRRYLVCLMVDNPYREGEKYQEEVGIRWDRIHGKRRKLLKWNIRKAEKRIREQYAMWNKYAGCDDVLYIHSRMGGRNWRYYDEKESITGQPWLLGRVDDYFDDTYCDFYAKLRPKEDDHE